MSGEQPATCVAVRFDESVACERCGQFGAFLFDGKSLCADCYEHQGSCCPEFGADDLWSDQKDSSRSADH